MKKTTLPVGMHDKLFKRARVTYTIERDISDFLMSQGFHRIETPTLEHFEVFNDSVTSNHYHFFDKSGELLTLRPDITSQIGRVIASTHVETCVLLSHKSADDFISVKMEYADDRKIQPDRITYRLIQEYIEEKYGFKVHTANIAEVKRNLGLPMYDAPNAVEELKRPYKPAPEYKVEAIKDALRHFKVID